MTYQKAVASYFVPAINGTSKKKSLRLRFFFVVFPRIEIRERNFCMAEWPSDPKALCSGRNSVCSESLLSKGHHQNVVLTFQSILLRRRKESFLFTACLQPRKRGVSLGYIAQTTIPVPLAC